MGTPTVDTLYPTFAQIFKQFSARSVCFPDSHGNWQTDPDSLRGRIANEWWFRVWRYAQREVPDRYLKKLCGAFTRTIREWEFIVRVYHRLPDAFDEASPGLIVLELLYFLIAYTAYRINSQVYVADWDTAGDSRRRDAAEEVKRFTRDILHDRSEDAVILHEMIHYLDEQDDRIFRQVSSIIAEEESVRHQLQMILDSVRQALAPDSIMFIRGEKELPSLNTLTNVREALLRPCLNLLLRTDIPIATGLQYESAIILSTLADERCAEHILRALALYPEQYTNIRCNLLYALGNIGDENAVPEFMRVLQRPERVAVQVRGSDVSYEQTLDWEKCEAIWALGKCTTRATAAIPLLAKYATTNNQDIAIALAWAMNHIGRAQKEDYGGIDAQIVVTLMQLLVSGDPNVFEEVACSLKSLELPDFLHTLYLHSIRNLPILALKPCNTGLFELSETIHHLSSIKQPVIMSVTGDSGTGKTYFCNALLGGFGSIKSGDILYLMRDAPAHVDIFNRMLGLKRLKENLDSVYYMNYPLAEKDDDPDGFLHEFLRQHADKKLILLDGWMDSAYFYQIVKLFYEKRYLDVLVNFRATLSTRRRNLEDRERVLEKVKACLACVERPYIEETEFYRDCDVLVYNLDNSSQSRLNAEEIREVFTRQKVEQWGDYIRIGAFREQSQPIAITTVSYKPQVDQLEQTTGVFNSVACREFIPVEQHFHRTLNEDGEYPHLLQTVRFDAIDIERIVVYSQGQLGFCGRKGEIGILSGLNDRVFYATIHDRTARSICISGSDIVSYVQGYSLYVTSFARNTVYRIEPAVRDVTVLASNRSHLVVTGHDDGSVRIWDMTTHTMTHVRAGASSIIGLSVDHQSRVYALDRQGSLKVLTIGGSCIHTLPAARHPLTLLCPRSGGGIVCTSSQHGEGAMLHIADVEAGTLQNIQLPDIRMVRTAFAYFDGRLISCLEHASDTTSVAVIDPRPKSAGYVLIGRHGEEVHDCLAMGPRIITCGSEGCDRTLKIWGTRAYVSSELSKLKLIASTMMKPGYYRTLF